MSHVSVTSPVPTVLPTAPTASVAAPSLDDIRRVGGSLQRGMRGEAVRWLQQRLGLPADGTFGLATEEAVAAFQRRNGLPADGKAGQRTIAALDGDRFDGGGGAGGGRAQGTSRSVRGYRDVSAGRFAALLPSHARHLAPAFQRAARTHGLDPVVLLAIAKLESADFTSSAYRRKNNATGISNARGPIAFAHAADSVERMARLLGDPSGPYRRARTIAEVGRIYSPPGAGNDVHGTNGGWPKHVARSADRLWAQLG